MTTEDLARELERLTDPSGGTARKLDDFEAVRVNVATLRAAAARLRELSEALKPFGSWAADNTEADPFDPESGVWSGNRCERERIVDWFGPTDFRRAAQLTEKQP